jgi:hypothetical protein
MDALTDHRHAIMHHVAYCTAGGEDRDKRQKMTDRNQSMHHVASLQQAKNVTNDRK